MNKIDTLIEQLCPKGVEFKELQDVVILTMGTSPAGNTFSPNPETGIEFHQGKTSFGNEIIKHSNIYTTSPIKIAEPDSLIMSVRAPVGATNLTNRKIAIGRGLCSMIGKNGLMTKFLYYFINDNIQTFKNKSNGSTFEAINTIDIKQISIPIPPLPIQQEIVNILDKLTQLEADLEAELEAELKARRAQYACYRAKLLDFSDINGGGYKWLSISKICLKTENIKWKENINTDFQYIDLSSVSRSNNKVSETLTINSTNAPSRAQQILKEDDVIFGTTRPTLKRYCLITPEYDGQICSTGFCVLRANKEFILPKYLFFILTTPDFYNYVENNQEGAGYPSISNSLVKRFIMPIPPLIEQERIVAILAKFDTLVNDFGVALPAEIEARRKQYEYYREKLLSFKMMSA